MLIVTLILLHLVLELCVHVSQIALLFPIEQDLLDEQVGVLLLTHILNFQMLLLLFEVTVLVVELLGHLSHEVQLLSQRLLAITRLIVHLLLLRLVKLQLFTGLGKRVVHPLLEFAPVPCNFIASVFLHLIDVTMHFIEIVPCLVHLPLVWLLLDHSFTGTILVFIHRCLTCVTCGPLR